MKLIYEFIGTFFLVLTVGMTLLEPMGSGLLAPLAIGSALAVMVFAGAHISGGHYNPAVSLAIYVRGKMHLNEMLGYWLVQFFAGIIAAYVTIYFKGNPAPMPMQPEIIKALIGEFLFTFALCFVVLNVATAKATHNNSYYGLAIGLTVLIGAYSVGPISGGAFNPAVALGITIMNMSMWSNLWIFLIANLLGGVVAAFAFLAAHSIEEGHLQTSKSRG